MNFLNRLKVGHRFLLSGSMSLVLTALPTYFFLRGEFSDLQVIKQEQTGVVPARTVYELARLLQQHRGFSGMALAGNAQAQGKLPELRQTLERKQQDLERHLAELAFSQKTVAEWRQLQTDWQALRQRLDQPGVKPADSFALHSALIRRLQHGLTQILDDSGLTLDPEADTYHLIIAAQEVFFLVEQQAKLRGFSAALLTRQTVTPEELVQVHVLADTVNGEYERIGPLFDKAFAENPQAKERLFEKLQAMSAASTKALALTQAEVLAGKPLTFSPDTYFKVMTEALEHQFVLADDVWVLVDALLQERSTHKWRVLYLVLGAMGLTMLLGTLLSVLGGRSVTRQLGGEPEEVTGWVQAMSQGDLTAQLPGQRLVKPGSVVHAVTAMQANLQQMVREVRGSADQVVEAASQIASGNNELSGRTERQAGAVQEISSSMEELLSTVRQNSDNARQANVLASSAADVAVRGGEQMGAVVSTMDAINASAKKIGDIIGVIDGIAFQTNILALNAAVEAARAGEQGRGFAVVATEVRDLAQRSAVAAKEIKGLISDSIEKVGQGTSLVAETGSTMQEVVSSVKRVTDIMGEVAASSLEQTAGIEQVNSGVVQMDQVTQQNAALVQQAAASADGLREQSTHLRALVSSFKVASDGGFSAAGGVAAAVPSPRSVTAPPVLAPRSQAARLPLATAVSRPPISKKTTKPPVLAQATPKPAPPPPSPPAETLKRPVPGNTGGGVSSENDWEEF